MVPLDLFKQVNPQTFKLVGADARERPRADGIKVEIDELVGELAHGQPGGIDLPEDKLIFANNRDRRMQLVTAPGQGPQLVAGRSPVVWFIETPASERKRLIGANHDALPPLCATGL